MNEILAHHTGQDLEKIRLDTDRDFWMTATEAHEYGVVDTVISGREVTAALSSAGD